MIWRLTYLLAILLVYSSCTEMEMEEIRPVFDGITETDHSGVIKAADANDWLFNASWTSMEEKLFSESFESVCSLENYRYKVVAYPNPCVDNCYLYINMPMGHRFVYRLVDDNFNILDSGETTEPAVCLNVARLKLGGQVLRLYYKIFTDECELRGHGDIQLQ